MWKVFSQRVNFKKLMQKRTFPTVSSDIFKVSDEVLECLQHNKPVVALESTIITHGMPFPQDLRTALKVEEIVRKNGATPATIGIVNGKVRIGMSQEELEFVARKEKGFLKVSRRDLPYVLSKGLTGGTTVAATMLLSHRAGISVFVTGGIGGVHRDGEMSMDVSTDLIELSRTPMTVISAGIKSILDIGRTLEVLETHGVCVASFGPSKAFPAFFSQDSGFASPCNVETVSEAAHLIGRNSDLSLYQFIA